MYYICHVNYTFFIYFFQKTFLLKIGGHTRRENIRNVLNRIFTNECSMKCSWKGRRENFAIYKLSLIAIMKGTYIFFMRNKYYI